MERRPCVAKDGFEEPPGEVPKHCCQQDHHRQHARNCSSDAESLSHLCYDFHIPHFLLVTRYPSTDATDNSPARSRSAAIRSRAGHWQDAAGPSCEAG